MSEANPDSRKVAAAELARLDKENADKSLLRKGIDFLTEPYHHEAAAREKLFEAASGHGDADAALRQVESASASEQDAYSITSRNRGAGGCSSRPDGTR